MQSCIDGDCAVGEPRLGEGSRGIVGMSFSTIVMNLLRKMCRYFRRPVSVTWRPVFCLYLELAFCRAREKKILVEVRDNCPGENWGRHKINI